MARFSYIQKEACTFAILHRYRLLIFVTREFPKLLLFYRNVTRRVNHRLFVNLNQVAAIKIRNGGGFFFRFQLRPHGIHNADRVTINPPVERFLEAFDKTSADVILVFPNNSNILLTARQAAELYKDSDVRVIPTKTLGEGYFALANLDASQTPEEMKATLTEAAAAVTTGSVSRAIRDTAEARTGEFIGFSGKDILCSCPAREEAVRALAEKLEAKNADICILLKGADAPAEEAEGLRTILEKSCPLTEVILLDGGQPVYDYILVLC